MFFATWTRDSVPSFFMCGPPFADLHAVPSPFWGFLAVPYSDFRNVVRYLFRDGTGSVCPHASAPAESATPLLGLFSS